MAETDLVCQKCYTPVNQLGQINSSGRFPAQPTDQVNSNVDSTTGNYGNDSLIALSIQYIGIRYCSSSNSCRDIWSWASILTHGMILQQLRLK